MQVIEQEQADDATGQAVRHGAGTGDDCTGSGDKRVRDANRSTTARARNVGQPLAVRLADAVRLGTRLPYRIRLEDQP